MIYQNTDFNKLPDALELRRILNIFQDRFPVKHLMPSESIVDGAEDKYLLTQLSDGMTVLKPNITHQGLLFYGNSEFNPERFILPYFKESRHDNMLERNVKLEQFKLLIESFPLYAMLKNGIDLPKSNTKIRMENPYGIASAYHLDSPFLNLTSSIDIALFYATHKYEDDKYVPVKEGVGIVYFYVMDKPFGQIPGLFTLGLQVFPRTFYNKQFLLRLKPNEDFNKKDGVFGFSFKQSEKASEEIAEKISAYKKIGDTNDFLAKKLAKLSDKVYQKAVELNYSYNPSDDLGDNIKYLTNNGEKPLLPGAPQFTKDDLNDVNLYDLWSRFCDSIYCESEKEYLIMEELRKVPFMVKYENYFK